MGAATGAREALPGEIEQRGDKGAVGRIATEPRVLRHAIGDIGIVFERRLAQRTIARHRAAQARAIPQTVVQEIANSTGRRAKFGIAPGKRGARQCGQQQAVPTGKLLLIDRQHPLRTGLQQAPPNRLQARNDCRFWLLDRLGDLANRLAATRQMPCVQGRYLKRHPGLEGAGGQRAGFRRLQTDEPGGAEDHRQVGISRRLLAERKDLAYESVRLARRAGVKIAAGTDFGGGSLRANQLAWEVESLVEAGLEPWEALAAATWQGGDLLGA